MEIDLSQKQIEFLLKYFGKNMVEWHMKIEEGNVVMPMIQTISIDIEECRSAGFKKVTQEYHWEDNPNFDHNNKFDGGCSLSPRKKELKGSTLYFMI